MSAFLTLYESLPRQGPGDRQTLDFALRIIGTGGSERILDAGCGTGADIDGLLCWAPTGHVTAVDAHAPFIDQIATRYASDPRVDAIVGDMAAQSGPFDLIWSAGALYFLGLQGGLHAFRKKLAPGGALVFSHPAYFTMSPSRGAQAFWEGEGEVLHSDAVCDAVREAGFDILDATSLPDAAWEAYYTPLQARIDALKPNATGDMAKTLVACQHEIDGWRSVKSETGYLQIVAVRQ
ncbi:MAG: class I SAM-dependent methyltransferase [Boseongicola sp.]|nr:class I SAM-dependent methyltransferase [Boseongicola sp.]